MEVTLKVKRQPVEGAGAVQDFALDVSEDATVMDALLKARDEQDGGLSFRADCMRGFCGACAYRVNGEGILACVTPVSKTAKNGEVIVEPIRETGVIKDLVYDLDTFLWDKVKAVKPAVTNGGGLPAEEKVMDQAVVQDLQEVMSCVMCGLCDEGCTVIAVDKTFLGPAALTRAYRAIKDPRDGETKQRLELLDKSHGVWDCTHCFEANGHCPKGINPTDRIFVMRDMLLRQGVKNRPVARHHDSFASSVKASGWVDEGRVAVDSIGWTNIPGLLKFLPTAFKALRRGKAPLPYLHRKRAGAKRIRRIMEKVETNKP